MDSQQNRNAFILQPGSYIIKSMFCCVKPGSFSPTAVLTNPARNNKYIVCVNEDEIYKKAAHNLCKSENNK